MKIEIGLYEAKTKLAELLRQVKAGKSFTITNRGEAIADLVPSAGVRVKDKVAAADKLKASCWPIRCRVWASKNSVKLGVREPLPGDHALVF
ncbi:MAG: type II toxin-antitoxin system Phd/YefM family antitoxin [Sulfuriferula sp.]